MIEIERTIFIPTEVFENWISPIWDGLYRIRNSGIDIEFYNEDEMGINARVKGSKEIVDEVIESITILTKYQQQINDI